MTKISINPRVSAKKDNLAENIENCKQNISYGQAKGKWKFFKLTVCFQKAN